MSESIKGEVTEKDFNTFLDISVYLTGFSINDLLATGMPETYYYTIMKEADQKNVRKFFEDAQSIMNNSKDNKDLLKRQIAERLIPAEKYVDLAKRIILLWYTGIWTSVTVKVERTSAIVSGESYTQGLIWTAAETHPAGAKHPGYESWSLPPL
jgi:hypothetical protein